MSESVTGSDLDGSPVTRRNLGVGDARSLRIRENKKTEIYGSSIDSKFDFIYFFFLLERERKRILWDTIPVKIRLAQRYCLIDYRYCVCRLLFGPSQLRSMGSAIVAAVVAAVIFASTVAAVAVVSVYYVAVATGVAVVA